MPGFTLCSVNNLKIQAKIQCTPDSMGICRWQDKTRSLLQNRESFVLSNPKRYKLKNCHTADKQLITEGIYCKFLILS